MHNSKRILFSPRVFLFVLVFLAVEFSPRQTTETKIRLLDQPVPPLIAEVKEYDQKLPELLPLKTLSTQIAELKIPAIGVNVDLGHTNLDAFRHLQVPEDPAVAAWYESGPKVGEAGTVLITGHMDSALGPGVFYNLDKLAPADEITVGMDNGSTATYIVEKLVSYPQDDSFPWIQVYSTTGLSALRIITCAGIYSAKTKRYSRDLVVFASLVSIN